MIKIILIFILSISSSFVSAQNDESFESRVERFSSQNRGIKCNFTQTKKVKNIATPIISRGLFYYDNRGLMALRYSDPAGDKIIIDGVKFTIVTAGKSIEGSADDNPMMTQICNMLRASMSGDVGALGRGWQMRIDETDGEYVARLEPTDRRTKKYIESLVMVFCKENMTLDELRMNESSGGYTLYEFSDKEINGSIDPKNFE